MPKILYLVHNLGDPAVERRVAMLRMGGADVDVVGFRRADAPAPRLGLGTVVELAQTHDGRMAHRLAATLRAVLGAGAWSAGLSRPDAILARNLEMLAVAARLHRHWRHQPRLVYECLDLHRLMLRRDALGRSMRAVERRLLRRADLLVTSSPAFLRHHFDQFAAPPPLLVENKAFAPGRTDRGRNAVFGAAGGPWRIGWFGALRCRKSLAALAGLATRAGGSIGIDLRGRPALTAFDDFHAEVEAAPHLRYLGPYRPEQLAEHYSAVHFAWAIDFFEEGQNSTWLLPNRIYEGCLHGAIPIALAGTETAAFIERLGIGVVVPDIRPDTLDALFAAMTADRVRALATAVAAQDPALFAVADPECRALVERLAPLPTATPLDVAA